MTRSIDQACLDFYPRPRVEGDDCYCRERDPGNDFYPRPRVEGDRDKGIADQLRIAISTHALA